MYIKPNGDTKQNENNNNGEDANNEQRETTTTTTTGDKNQDGKSSSADPNMMRIERFQIGLDGKKKTSFDQNDPEFVTYENGGDSNGSSRHLFEGIFGCIRPFLSLLYKPNNLKDKYHHHHHASHHNNRHDSSANTTTANTNTTELINIPFEQLKDLQWLGSGAQGCVFKGYYKNEEVAIKKVRSKEEANVKHLMRLNHPNLVKLKGVSFNDEKFSCIVMEYCPYGQLYTHLSSLKDKELLKPTQMLDWSRQIAHGMNYLHMNKIIHRDLKSPNILISYHNQIKISDFGASKKFTDKSMVMSFKGTVAWMAPEVIRNEQCSEKVDIYSFGVVLWELMTCEVPYKSLDQNSIMWGVGSNKLKLPVPSTAPEGLRMLLLQCLNIKPRNRPSFAQILRHLDVVASNETMLKLEEEYHRNQLRWRQEVSDQMLTSSKNENLRIQLYNYETDLVQKRKEELKHATDIRELYEQKLEKANNLYMELNTVLLQLDERERELLKRERAFGIPNKKVVRPILRREFQSFNENMKQQQQQPNHLQPAIGNGNNAAAGTSTTTTPTTTPNSPPQSHHPSNYDNNNNTSDIPVSQSVKIDPIDLTDLYYQSYLCRNPSIRKKPSSTNGGLVGRMMSADVADELERASETRSSLGQRRFRSSKRFKHKTKAISLDVIGGGSRSYANLNNYDEKSLCVKKASMMQVSKKSKPGLEIMEASKRIDMIDASSFVVKHGRELVGLIRKKLKERARQYLDITYQAKQFKNLDDVRSVVKRTMTVSSGKLSRRNNKAAAATATVSK